MLIKRIPTKPRSLPVSAWLMILFVVATGLACLVA